MTQHSFQVRRLDAADARAYRALMLQAYASDPTAFTSTVEEREEMPESFWADRLRDPSGLNAAFGSFEGESLVGAVALSGSARPKTAHKAGVVGLYVLRDRRGRGIAQALLQALIAEASRRVGLRVLQLTVSEVHAATIAFYEGLGFRSFGTEPLAIRGADGFIGKVHMWLDLDPLRTPEGGQDHE